MTTLTIGILALQGAFAEHISLLRRAATSPPLAARASFSFIEVRTAEALARVDALVIPGGESTTMALVAARVGLLEPLREFIHTAKKPTWGTCAGMILLAAEANAATTKRGGQDLLGGLDVRVHRNHFGRQRESFETLLELPFLSSTPSTESSSSSPSAPAPTSTSTSTAAPFPAVFIRAPIVEALLSPAVEALAVLHRRRPAGENHSEEEEEDVVAVRQGHVFATSFHPELTGDARVHEWWLRGVVEGVGVKEEI